MQWLEFLKTGEFILGFIITVSGLLFGALARWDARTRRYADKHAEEQSKERDESNKRLSGRMDAMSGRLENVEGRLEAIDQDVEQLRQGMSQLARSKDVVDLKVSSAGMSAQLQQLVGHVDIIYRAMVEASK